MGAKYGACMNKNLYDQNNNSDPSSPGSERGYHCHYSSRACENGEKWMNPVQVETAGLECTCDDNYHANVYTNACYSMSTHIVSCVTEMSDCAEGAVRFGDRYNANDFVDETCGIGSNAYGAFMSSSCGKRCLCNFGYTPRDDILVPAATDYGKCFDPVTRWKYCAVNAMTCGASEEYIGPFDDRFSGLSGPRCGCDRTRTGACMKEDIFQYCAVEEDSCKRSMSFHNARQLMDGDSDVDCRLCVNTWDAPTVSPAPTDPLTQPPTESPTVSQFPTAALTLSPTVGTAPPSAAPSTEMMLCSDDPSYAHGGNLKKNCKWIAKNRNKDALCKKKTVAKACQIVCGVCCADDPAGVNDKKCARFLTSAQKKTKRCKKASVNVPCALSCGRCCYSDRDYAFLVNGNEKPCSFISNDGKKNRFCKGETQMKCGVECGCTDYTGKAPR